MYHTSDWLIGIRRWLSDTYYLAIPLFYGNCWWNPFKPIPTRLRICVGTPIKPPQLSEGVDTQDKSLPEGGHEETRKEELRRLADELHATYCTALQKLFDDNKKDAGFANATLKIV